LLLTPSKLISVNINVYAGINLVTVSPSLDQKAERQTSEKGKYPGPSGWGLND